MGIVSQFKGDDGSFENRLLTSGILTISATTLFATFVEFNLDSLASGIYLILLTGVAYLTVGILSKKGSL